MRSLVWSFIGVLVLGFLFLPWQVQATEFGPISVTVDTPSGDTRHGYQEYKLIVTNRSNARHRVRLTIPKEAGSTYGNLRDISRTVEVEPESSALVSIFQPPLGLPSDGNVSVQIDGSTQQDYVPLRINQHGMDRYNGTSGSSVVLSQGAAKSDFQIFASKYVLNTEGKPGFNCTASDVPVTDWSTNWLGYSRFDGVVVTAEEFRSMPTAVQSALWRYVACGGALLICGPVEFSSKQLARMETQAGLTNGYVGFGQCQCTKEKTPADFTFQEWEQIQKSFDKTSFPFHSPKGITDANRVFPVVDSIRVPVRGLFFLMLMFVIVIGPVNLLVLSRLKKKIWLLWTVPTISLVTCLAVAGYTSFSEGYKGFSRTEGLTILDETSHQATTIGWTAYYTPLTPGDGLRFGTETELTPQVWSGYYHDNTSQRTLDWTQDQHLASGWVTARIPAHFMVRKAEVRRERLTISKDSKGNYSVVNGLGAAIKDLWWADQDGKVFKVSNIPAGAQGGLLSTGIRAQGQADSLREIYTWDWLGNLYNFSSAPEKVLMPGSYIALLDSFPFIEDGLHTVVKKQAGVVYGITGAPGNEN